ncbi:hypothetical protein EXU48_03005 [Occultella glacieicola]|uniref:Uncharacterized protein n=1 Tax=Occultella glacieicola TaxID=2518684 RepID=A0ABY2E6M3_9MICO|nr:hypothetical protein [Occultella glacieicola]TDE97198.1 hypothetical protein EXU48_03005 [Occultella glacieicola]
MATESVGGPPEGGGLDPARVQIFPAADVATVRLAWEWEVLLAPDGVGLGAVGNSAVAGRLDASDPSDTLLETELAAFLAGLENPPLVQRLAQMPPSPELMANSPSSTSTPSTKRSWWRSRPLPGGSRRPRTIP